MADPMSAYRQQQSMGGGPSMMSTQQLKSPTATATTRPSPRSNSLLAPSYVMDRNQQRSLERRADGNTTRSSGVQQQQQREGVAMNMAAQQRQPGTKGRINLKSLSKAQQYALAAKLARASPQPGTAAAARPPQQQPPKQQQQQPLTARPPRKQRVITPEMVARRPVEVKHNIMMRSKHKKVRGSGGASVAEESVNSDATEHIQNNRSANARRKRHTTKSHQRAVSSFVPTLERVDTLEAVLDQQDEDQENMGTGAVNNLQRLMSRKQQTTSRTNSSTISGSVSVASSKNDKTKKTKPAAAAAVVVVAEKKVVPRAVVEKKKTEVTVEPTTLAVTKEEVVVESSIPESASPSKPSSDTKSEPETAAATTSNSLDEKRVAPVASEEESTPAVASSSSGIESKTSSTANASGGGTKKKKSKKRTKKQKEPKSFISRWFGGADSQTSSEAASESSGNNSAGKDSSSQELACKVNAVTGVEAGSSNIESKAIPAVETDKKTAESKPKLGKKSSLSSTITVAEYALTTGARQEQALPPQPHDEVANQDSLQTIESLVTLDNNDSLLTVEAATIQLEPSLTHDDADTAPAAIESVDSIKTEADEVADDSPTVDKKNDSTVVADVAAVAATATKETNNPLTINTGIFDAAKDLLNDAAKDLFSAAVPSSILSPVNKEDVEIQLPTTSAAAEEHVAAEEPVAADTVVEAAPKESSPGQSPAQAAATKMDNVAKPPALVIDTAKKVAEPTPKNDIRSFFAPFTPGSKKKVKTPAAVNRKKVAESTPAVKEMETPRKKPEPEVKVEAPKKEVDTSAAAVPKKTAAAGINSELEKSNERVDKLKNELLQLARPSFQNHKTSSNAPTPYEVVEHDGASSNNSNASENKSSGSQEESQGGSNESPPKVSDSSKGSKNSKASSSTPVLKLNLTPNRKKKTIPAEAKSSDKPTKSNTKKGKSKKKRPAMKTFLGKKSKVIEEEEEYTPNEEEDDERDDIEAEVAAAKDEAGDERELVEEEEDPIMEERSFPAKETIQSPSATNHATAPRIQVEEEYSESEMSLAMKSTLSNAEFMSVESSITTDKEAFAYKPGVLKRTASLVKNPALALKNRSRSKQDKRGEEEELLKRMKEGRKAARADNRKREEFNEECNSLVKSESKKVDNLSNNDSTPESEDTDIQPEEIEQLQQMLVQDDTIEDTIGVNQEFERGVSFVGGDDDSMYHDNDVDGGMLTSKGTFDDTYTKQQHAAQQQVRFQTAGTDGGTQTSSPLATYPTVRTVSSGILGVTSMPSREMATQTSDSPEVQPPQVPVPQVQVPQIYHQDQQSLLGDTMLPPPPMSSNEPGSFSHVMESMGLFGAKLCMGTSRAMVSCADSCSDNPRHIATQRISSNDSFVAASPRHSVPSTPQAGGQDIFRFGPSVMNNGGSAERDAEGVLTRALAVALRTTMGERDIPISEQSQAVDDMATPRNDPVVMQQPKQTTGNTADTMSYAGIESIDGRFVSIQQQQQRRQRKKRVPKNIAVKPKHHHTPQQHEEYEEEMPMPLHDMDRLGVIEEVPELQRTRSKEKKTKKGIGGFLKKLTKAKLAVMYEV